MKDDKIIELLRQNNTDKAFYKLYEAYPMVRKFVIANGGNKAESEDLFQEALIILYKKVTTTEFELTSKLSTYLFSICKYMWKDELKRKNKQIHLDENTPMNSDSSLDLLLQNERKLKSLEGILNMVTEKCLQIFDFFYFQKLSMKEIASKMNYSSESVAKTQKFKCIEQARSKMSTLKFKP